MAAEEFPVEERYGRRQIDVRAAVPTEQRDVGGVLDRSVAAGQPSLTAGEEDREDTAASVRSTEPLPSQSPGSTKPPQRTSTSKLQVAVFPEGSVAVQTTVVMPSGKVDPDGGSQTTVALSLPVLSVAVTSNWTTAPSAPVQRVDMLSPGHVSIGTVVSTTMTSCWQLDELPAGSVAVQVTKVSPIGNLGGASFESTMSPEAEQLSVAVASPSSLPVTN